MMSKKKQMLREQQSLETKQTLLDQSLQLFVLKGYAGTTVRDIAKAAKVSPGLMFHYFPSKEALLRAHVKVMASGIDSVVQRLTSSNSPLDTFQSVAKITLDSLRESYSRNLFLLANQIFSFESIPQGIKRMVSNSKSIEASASLIALGQRRGEIRHGDPHALAVAFWGAIQGIAEILVWNPRVRIPDPEHVVCILKP